MVQKVLIFVHFCSIRTHFCAFLIIFYHIILAYTTQALHTNPVTFVFSRKTKIGLKITSEFSAKNPIFLKKPLVLQQQKKQKAAKWNL